MFLSIQIVGMLDGAGACAEPAGRGRQARAARGET